MTRYFHPVIHVDSERQACTQAKIAFEAEADGIWLINHNIPAEKLWDVFLRVRQEHPDQWIGLNFLDLSGVEAMALVCSTIDVVVNGLWVDRSGIDDVQVHPLAEVVWRLKHRCEWSGLYFGGVAFKYQATVRDLSAAVTNAVSYMDVVTTSGDGTGKAASVDKIRQMSSAPKLAIASGVTAENVKDFLPYVSYFLVATGISKSFTELDPERTKRLSALIHEA